MINETSLQDATKEEARNLICGYWPTASRLHFTIHGDTFYILPPTINFVDDRRAVTWFEQMSGKTHEEPTNQLNQSLDMRTILQKLRLEEKLSGAYGSYGGAGVCGRMMEDEERDFVPGLRELLEQEKGKVVFIGNGLSPVPLVVAERYRKKQVSEAPVVHDMFTYSAMEYDLWHVITLLDAKKLPLPELLEQYSLQASAIVAAEKEGNIRLSEYYFGLGNPPDILKDASFVVNLMGPPLLTLNEQLSLLRVGGKLVHMIFGSPYRPNWHFRTVNTVQPTITDPQSDMAAEIIERIR